MNNIHHYYLLFIVYHPRGKNKLIELNNENKIDTSMIHIDSYDVIKYNTEFTNLLLAFYKNKNSILQLDYTEKYEIDDNDKYNTF
jgi:hypothetical protein